MASLKIEGFGGQIPPLDDRLLPNDNATVSQNVWLVDGKLKGLRELQFIRFLTNPQAKRVYRIPLGGPLGMNVENAVWMEFAGINTTVVRSPLAGQKDPAIYWAGDIPAPFQPRYNTLSRLTTNPGIGGMLLGVPQPISAPSVVLDPGFISDIQETRSYVYTYVSFLGEEGPPSLPSPVLTGSIDKSWTVTFAVPSPSQLGSNNPKPILSISPSTTAGKNSIVVSNHGFNVGDSIFFNGIAGMVQLNGLYGKVVAVDTPNIFRIDVDLSGFSPYGYGGTAQLSGRELTKVRIYRTIVSPQGVGSYNLVEEVPISAGKYVDMVKTARVALNSPLQSTFWFGPPALKGFATMPNGILIGWVDNQIWFSEPYQPHAWPAPYELEVASNIVGVGVVGQSAVICTESVPYLVTGTHPSNMVLSRIGSTAYPCISQGSIVAAPEGVYYLAEVGLILVGAGAPQLATKWLLSQDDWQKLVASDRFQAAILNGAYYGYTGLREDNSSDGRGGVLIDMNDKRIAFNTLLYNPPIANVMKDSWTNEVFVICRNEFSNGKLFHVDLTDVVPEGNYRWKSKIFRMDYPQNLSIARVFHTSPPGLLTPQSAIINVYASYDGNQDPVLIFSRTVPTNSGQYFRLPSGRLYDQYQFEFIGNLQIINFQAATSAKELRGV